MELMPESNASGIRSVTLKFEKVNEHVLSNINYFWKK
jgi:hypothetical protein